jgi:hypothetical protein
VESLENHRQVFHPSHRLPISLRRKEQFKKKLLREQKGCSCGIVSTNPFQDHLVLESNFDFRIILRLEYAKRGGATIRKCQRICSI